MQKVLMIRGESDKFYFVEKDKTQTYDIVYALEMIRPTTYSDCWRWKKYPIFELF